MSNNGPKSEFNGADETANNKPKASDEELPQTGEKDNKLGILGLLSVSLASLFFSSLADAFMKVTPITLGGAFVLLVGNFPIPAWTNF